ncbi:MAG: DNA polymerase [Nitrospirae bacterium]|nr:MAG: DNA polymerase [Nitrospirota bacterium]
MDEFEYQIGFYRTYLMDRGLCGLSPVEIETEELPDKERVGGLPTYVAKRIKPLEWKTPQLRVLAFDTEVVEPERGKRSLVMISLYGKDLQKVLTYKPADYPGFVEVVKDEKALIERFIEVVNEYDPDVVTGYNSDLFDFDVLRERAQKLRVPLARLSRDFSGVTLSKRARFTTARLKGRVHIDIFNFINNIFAPILQTEVLSLDAVSSEILGDEKIEMQYHEIVEAWQRERQLPRLAEYCLKDSELTFRLTEVLLPQIIEHTVIVGQSLFDVSRMTYSQLVEWFYSRKPKATGRVIPNQPKFEEIKARQRETYIGGYVKEPEVGLHENIAVVDFASLYPSIIATYNISTETLDCDCCSKAEHRVPGLNHWFCKKKEGFISTAIKELLKEREELKKQMRSLPKGSAERYLLDTRQKAVKTIANASYGYFGFAASKWYCKACAESITAFGRHWIQEVMKRAERAGFRPIYGDTDSAFLLVGERPREALIEFLEEINNELPGLMKLELEGFYLRGIFIPKEIGGGTAKKRYALVDEEGNLKVRGLEKVRRDWSQIARATQEALLKKVLYEADLKAAVEVVRGAIDKLRKGDFEIHELVVYEQLSKPLSEYKHTTSHVEAAKKQEKRGIELQPGSVVGYVITKGEGSISQRAEPVEFASKEDVDVDYYIENQILPAAMRILKTVGVEDKEITSQGPSLF